MNSPNESMEMNRRHARPLGIEQAFGQGFHAPPPESAAVAHLNRSAAALL
jgi:hypothetical protein